MPTTTRPKPVALRIELLDVAPDWWIEEIGHDRDTRGYRDERGVSVAAVASQLGIPGRVRVSLRHG